MSEVNFFKKNFPQFVTEMGECLSPYWDLFSAGVECATFELNNGCIQTLTKENAEQKEAITEAKKQIRNLLYVYQLGKNELATARIRAEAEQFLKESE